MKIRDVVQGRFAVAGSDAHEITDVVYDSRAVSPGALFVAMKGERADGHEYIEDAIKRGAAAVLCAKDRINSAYYRDRYPLVTIIEADDPREALAFVSHTFCGTPSERIPVIGITGTNGKTTTSYLIRAILEQWGRHVGLIGTISYFIKGESFHAPHTTPESPDFQSLLKRMEEAGCNYAVTEVSSHSLSQKRVHCTRFRTAIFTNLTRDHLDFHKTMEEYYLAKEKLFLELLEEGGAAVVNADDPYGMRLIAELGTKRKDVTILSYSLNDRGAALVATAPKATFNATTFTLKASQGGTFKEEMTTPLVGTMNVYNVLAAVGAALSLNVPLDIIKKGIATAAPVKGRLERVDAGQDFLAVVDYAHTEDALERLLVTARQLLESHHSTSRGKGAKATQAHPSEKGKIITVFGCGGDRDKGKRPKMGETAVRLSDFVIVTSDNPRSEDPKRIIKGIEKGIHGDNYIVIPDRKVAINMAVELASAGDIVVVAGKGHEEYQEIKGQRFHFSDQEVLAEAIRRMCARPVFGGVANQKEVKKVRC